jgi:hypothetical protein
MARRRSSSAGQSFGERFSALRNPRTLIALVGALALAGSAMVNSIANATNYKNAAQALRFRGDDAVATTLRADALMARAGRDRAKITVARTMAAKALAVQPLNGRALRIIGIADALNNGPAAGAATMAVANSQSRRDVFTQIWMFAKAADAGDVALALTHYDAAVRVTPESWNLMFPVLVRSLSNAEVAQTFVPYIRADNPWVGEFVRQAVRTGENPDALAMALAGGNTPDTAEMRGLEDDLVKRLIAGGYFPAMEQLVRSRSRAALAVSRRVDLSQQSFGPQFQPLYWLLDEANGASIDETNGAERPRIRVEILRGVSRVVATKFVTLPPGRYRFEASSTYARPVAQARFRWRLRCWRGNAYSIAAMSDPIIEQRQSVAMTIEGGADCPAAMIELEGFGPVYATDTEFMVEAVSLRKIG